MSGTYRPRRPEMAQQKSGHPSRAYFKENSSLHISSVKAAVFLAKVLNNLFSTKISICKAKFSIELHPIAYFRHWTDDHYCKNSLSSLHISIHHSTFCASLHG